MELADAEERIASVTTSVRAKTTFHHSRRPIVLAELADALRDVGRITRKT